MYYVFDASVIRWNNTNLQALVKDYSDLHQRYQQLWWYGNPLVPPTPSFAFLIEENAPTPDNYWTGSVFNLYSNKLVSIFKSLNIRFTSFDPLMIGQNMGKALPLGYKVFRLLETADAVDKEKSIFEKISLNRVELNRIRHLVLRDEFISSKQAFTRIIGYEHVTIIHKNIKLLLEDQNITGCEYTPIDEFSTVF